MPHIVLGPLHPALHTAPPTPVHMEQISKNVI